MVLEGILIRKQPYKERDIIATFLLRNGDRVSGYLYGGQGGGSLKKSDILQIGYCLRFKAESTGKGKGVLSSYKFSEWEIVWQHEHIRNHYFTFFFMTYLCELFEKIALPFTGDLDLIENRDLFGVLSNGLFALDKKPTMARDLKKIIFAKLIYLAGILPELSTCYFCEKELIYLPAFLFVHEGKCSCSHCTSEPSREDGFWLKPLFGNALHGVLKTNFQEAIHKTEELEILDGDVLEGYLWHHFHIKKESFRTLASFKGLKIVGS